MHFHGYRWDVQADIHTGRMISDPPPEIVRDNLRQTVVAPRTWGDAEAAVDWCGTIMGTPPEEGAKAPLDRIMWPEHNPPPAEILRRNTVWIRGQLGRGRDTVWIEWLKGGRFLSCIVVCCPGGMGCPTGR